MEKLTEREENLLIQIYRIRHGLSSSGDKFTPDLVDFEALIKKGYIKDFAKNKKGKSSYNISTDGTDYIEGLLKNQL